MSKKKNPKISYVLPVYNEEVNVASCIRSLTAFKGKKEIIVIDDGSTDHTPEILKSFGKQITVHTIKGKRKGAAACRNIGNKLATGDVIAVCDVDIYDPVRHSIIKKAFKDNPDLDVFSAAATCIDAADPTVKWKHPFIGWDFASKCTLCHPTVAYRRELALEFPYHETSVETDLFEFMLLDMYEAGATVGGTDTEVMYKMEKQRRRDKKKSNELKKKLYEQYGIEVPEERFLDE